MKSNSISTMPMYVDHILTFGLPDYIWLNYVRRPWTPRDIWQFSHCIAEWFYCVIVTFLLEQFHHIFGQVLEHLLYLHAHVSHICHFFHSHHGIKAMPSSMIPVVFAAYTHIRSCPQVTQPCTVHLLANCFQKVDANTHSSQEKHHILIFGIGPY